ncbi:MAG: hypothetical protein OXJ55_07575 [Caldilineaceae bacterium]|nr:hypothetical protein [Caldilineaceae bacterium]
MARRGYGLEGKTIDFGKQEELSALTLMREPLEPVGGEISE